MLQCSVQLVKPKYTKANNTYNCLKYYTYQTGRLVFKVNKSLNNVYAIYFSVLVKEGFEYFSFVTVEC